MLSLIPPIFRRFFFSSCSPNTRAVNFAVAGFLIPFPGVGVEVLLRLVVACALVLSVETADSVVAVVSADASAAAFFFRFLEPGAFLREWVKPCSARF